MSNLSTPACPRCCGTHVVAGSFDRGYNRADFLISDRRSGFIAALSSPWIRLAREAWLCTSCGLCWSSVHDLGEALHKIRVHGDDQLVGRVLKSYGEIADLSEDGD
jgi:hypothetical protein